MNKQKFQDQHASEFNKFLFSPCGQAMLSHLSTQMPAYEFPKEEHLLLENRGARRGYETCIRNIVSLSMFTPSPSPDVEATYGVPNKPTNQPKE